ncbi:formylglycine-generating enzyme family protein [Geminocystis sp. GBBB08]|uniref:formylglycine-generating enzyme family protein n=1 Tax=Geminocystis sp. GBBB08 TaxID=2604140 RepID=UPI0027E39813|nr:formylglycine-generating enzyme family protein [Geminocystis sp. GBBB08]MBL1209004.1 formylglycine-generating enzyme family protein [Geminocystis sp. GBBB08]
MNNLQKYKFEVVTINLTTPSNSSQGTLTFNRVEKETDYLEIDLGNNLKLDMVSIPEGKFIMGTPDIEQGRSIDETPEHEVSIAKFFVSKYPITQSQYLAIMNENPSFFVGENKPVENVSWFSAQNFCAKLSQLTGKKFRLLSEAEWEYACRANTNTPFYFGRTITPELANYKASFGYGDGGGGKWRQETTEVGIFSANNFGLYDLHGNVWEWCEDHWHENYDQAPKDGSAWLETGENLDEDSPRVIRGGSWDDTAYYCRAGVRLWTLPQFKGKLIGFRVAFDYNEEFRI